jgi:hypothetical protein
MCVFVVEKEGRKYIVMIQMVCVVVRGERKRVRMRWRK